MKISKKHHAGTLFTLFITALLLCGESFGINTQAPSSVEKFSPLYPTPQQPRTSLAILSRLSQMHYNKTTLDDELSSDIFDRYIQILDNSRSYFTHLDIDELETYRFRFDEALKSGNLRPAFLIFNRYHKHVITRLNYLIDTVNDGLQQVDINDNERLLIDRKDALRPKNSSDAEHLWHKQLQNSVINLKTAGKSIDEIETVLLKRYKNQLNRALQSNSNDVFQTYIDALTKTYDPHTQYFSPRSSEDFNIHMSLSLEGIGAVLQSEDEFTKVVRLVPAGPADKSGKIFPTDKIIGVAQGEKGEIIDVVGWRLDDVVQLIRGPKKSTVRLEIISGGSESNSQRKIIHIVRNTVKLEEQAAQKDIIHIKQNGRDYKIGLINLPTFYLDFKAIQENRKDYKSSTRDVKRLIEELQEEGIDGLVMDLRNNGGGSLQEANSLTGLFIKSGPTVQIRSSSGKVDVLRDEDKQLFYDGPLAVVVNRMSASASEIFAGAIQDYGRGVIIGSRTFGKGTVQSLLPLHNKGQLKITLAKFYRISGESNQNKGIIPDINYPSIYNQDDIGESALSNALPWDSISPADFSIWTNYQPLIAELRQNHDMRTQTNPDFIYLNKQMENYETLRNITTVSLSERTRIKEKNEQENTRLGIENDRRKAKGLKLIPDFSEFETEIAKHSENRDASLLDNDDSYLLYEAGHILVDVNNINPSKTEVAKNN